MIIKAVMLFLHCDFDQRINYLIYVLFRIIQMNKFNVLNGFLPYITSAFPSKSVLYCTIFRCLLVIDKVDKFWYILGFIELRVNLILQITIVVLRNFIHTKFVGMTLFKGFT